MKKGNFFLLVAASFLALTACNGKTDADTASADSTDVEQVESSNVGVGTEGPCTYEAEKFSVAVPAGWKVLNVDYDGVRIGVGDDHTKDAQIGITPRFNDWDVAVENQGK